MAKTCKELLQYIALISLDERVIQGISCNSRDIKKDWIFVAIKGVHQNGEDFIHEVLALGAVVISECRSNHPSVYQCVNPAVCLGMLLNEYYEYPSDKLFVIGITGTNGKTSTASLLKQMFEARHQVVTLMGTNGIEIDQELLSSANTTNGIMRNLEVFLRSIEQEIPILIMEVSSQAINENRIAFIRFDVLIYTNITHEHLDYHKTFIHYQYTKFKARNYLKENGLIILNQDRFELHELFDLRRRGVVTFGKHGGHLLIENIELAADHSSFTFDHINFKTNLLSLNCVYNLSACLLLFKVMNIPLSEQVAIVSKVKPIEGRMEVLRNTTHTFWIDFAHTPAALRILLDFAKRVSKGKVITVIGCGGDRDQDKRHQMGSIASTMSDITIFTEDNSRSEKTKDIIKAMMINVLNNVIIKEKREEAIKLAIEIASENDLIIVAGKGNEQFLIVNDDKIPYNDKAFIQQCFAGKDGIWK